MTKKYRLAFAGSPFIPIFDHSPVLEQAANLYYIGANPAPALAVSSITIMLRYLPVLETMSDILSKYGVNKKALRSLTQGFSLPLSTISLAALCEVHPEEEWPRLHETACIATHDFDTLVLQDKMLQSLRANVNLLKLDPSGAQNFAYHSNYPAFTDEFFVNGIEIAAIVFFGLAPIFAKVIDDDRWLTAPYDPTIT